MEQEIRESEPGTIPGPRIAKLRSALPINPEILDVPHVATWLSVGRNTVYDLVARNAIPHRRLGKQIRFSRDALMRWLDSWSLQGAKEGH